MKSKLHAIFGAIEILCITTFWLSTARSALHPKSFDPGDIERIADHITRFSPAGIRELAEGKSAAFFANGYSIL